MGKEMLILSKFHDYYDTAIAFGVDKTIIYRRKTEVVVDGNGYFCESHIYIKNKRYIYTKLIIGFAGVMYPVIMVDNQYFYNKEDLLKHAADNKIPLQTKWWDSLSRFPYTITALNDFFLHDKHEECKEIFIKYKSPIFVYTKGNKYTIINPCLKEYGFVKIKDPFTAFQDIMQYISGVLGVGEPNIIEISNEDMRDKKGFDKWSFKKHKLDNKKSRKK